jgi:hypothetical protein
MATISACAAGSWFGAHGVVALADDVALGADDHGAERRLAPRDGDLGLAAAPAA